MRASHTPFRGLPAGVLALVTFASAAVAMTAGGSSNGAATTAQAVTAQMVDGLRGDRDGVSGDAREGHHR
jgi:hypothetical protein